MTNFSRTGRILQKDRLFRFAAGTLVGGALLVAWGIWFSTARITLYEVSESARLEVDRAIYPLQSPVAGRVVASHLTLGREVEQGEVLVELDPALDQLRLDEQKARREALEQKMWALGRELAAEELMLRRAPEERRVALAEVQGKQREVEATARMAEEEARRIADGYHSGYLAELESLRLKTQAEKERAVADTLTVTIDRIDLERRQREGDQQVRIERLKRELGELKAQLTANASEIERLIYEIDKRRVRAPAKGRLVEVANVRAGTVVSERDRFGVVVAEGTLKVAAYFPAAKALGRLEPGQHARMRLDGFPWTQYGTLAADVASIGTESDNGRVRVELAVRRDPASIIPLTHGLVGTVEVSVESAAPAVLVLRAASLLKRRAPIPPPLPATGPAS